MLARSTPLNGAGFLLGTFRTCEFYKDFLRRKAVKAAIIVAPHLISPRRAFRVMETLLYPAKQQTRGLPDAELLDIAVVQKWQGSGVGRALFQRFSRILSDKGVAEFRVTTGESLPQAHRFYEQLGARRVSDIEVHKGQTTRVYVCKTAEQTADSGENRQGTARNPRC